MGPDVYMLCTFKLGIKFEKGFFYPPKKKIISSFIYNTILKGFVFTFVLEVSFSVLN